MTLLQDIQRLIAEQSDGIDILQAADELGATIANPWVHIDWRRWGDTIGTVFSREGEYVMYTRYVYGGESEGDPEQDAYEVQPKETVTVEWVPIRP